MESGFSHKQRVIQALSDVFWTMQFTRNIPKNDGQHFSKTTSQRSVGKLYGRFCHSSKDNGRIGRTNDLISEDSQKTQFVF